MNNLTRRLEATGRCAQKAKIRRGRSTPTRPVNPSRLVTEIDGNALLAGVTGHSRVAVARNRAVKLEMGSMCDLRNAFLNRAFVANRAL